MPHMNSLLRHPIIGLSLTGLLGFGVAGCGVSGQLAATPTKSGTSHISGTVKTARTRTLGSTSPSPSASSARNSTFASSSNQPTTSVPTSTTQTTTPTGTSSPYTAVVTQALHWLQARTPQPLGAPRWIPRVSDARGQYVSPTTNVSAQGWAIFLHLTPRPYEVNNPAINQSPHTQNWVSWGLNVMTPSQLKTHQLGLLEAYGQMGPSHPPATTGTAQSVSLGTGITGSLYGNGTVVWHEGDWTLMVQGTGTNGTPDITEAKTLVAYLHTAYLPPYPGFVDVYQNTASVDWLKGRLLFSIMGGHEPALDVLHMAASWHPYSG